MLLSEIRKIFRIDWLLSEGGFISRFSPQNLCRNANTPYAKFNDAVDTIYD